MKRFEPKNVRKRAVLAAMLFLLCVSLCSCSFSLETALTELKAYINGTEVSQPPADFVESREGKQYTYDVYLEYVVLTGYIGEAVEVQIPAKIDGFPVRKIAGLAFYEGVDVVSVTVPEGVKELEENAFYYCSALTSVTLPDSLEKIGDKAFSWCTSLTEVTLPEKIREIPAYCFNQCTSLKNVAFPEEITSVGTRAFSGCSSLESLRFGDTVAAIGNYAFRDCAMLSEVRLPGECVPGEAVFDGCAEGFAVVTEQGSVCWEACIELGVALKTEDGKEVMLPVESSAETFSDETSDAEISIEE